MKLLYAILLIDIALLCWAFGDPPPPPIGGGGTSSTNTVEITPRPVEHGAIYGTSIDAIEWWNLNNHVFTVEWRERLTDGTWAVIGEGFKDYKHNNPDGFYRVLEVSSDVVFPVFNSGTDDMLWTASTTSVCASVECYNTNLIPEWGEGWIVVRVAENAPLGDIIIDVSTVGAYAGQTQQVTVVVQ